MSAAITAESEGLTTLIVERSTDGCGGQAAESTSIENFLGFPAGVTGKELADRAISQCEKFGTVFMVPARVSNVQQSDGKLLVTTEDGTIIPTRTVILALGVSYRPLEVEGVARLIGRGVKYGSPKVDESYEGDVVVVGGANSAGQAVIFLCKQKGCRVHMVVRNEALSSTMSAYLIERIKAASNIVMHYNSQVKEAHGDPRLESVVITSPTGNEVVNAKEMFISIGSVAKTKWLPDGIALDERGQIYTGNDVPTGHWRLTQLPRPPFFMETSMPGVFAAGDVRHGSIKRIASAVAEGAMAVQNIHGYLALK
ncbi:MAG: NAD(P)/FAD-dependent oxidoreductase [Minisyncoccia bacterium]